MGRLGAQVLALVTIFLPLCALVLMPFLGIVLEGKLTWWRMTIAVVGGYLLVAIAAGFYAYTIVPADYTRSHHWTAHPVSNSLGENHAVALERMQHPGAMSPEVAAVWQDRIRQERRAFVGDWLKVTMTGLVLPFLVLLGWRSRKRGAGKPGLSRSLPVCSQ